MSFLTVEDLVVFAVVAIWNTISPWIDEGWANCFFFNNFILAAIIGAVSTVWFSIGTTIDLRRLFRRLREWENNILDDGRVVGNISADDIAMVETVENTVIQEAHRNEALLEEALQAEQDDEDINNLHQHQKESDDDSKERAKDQ